MVEYTQILHDLAGAETELFLLVKGDLSLEEVVGLERRDRIFLFQAHMLVFG